MVCKIQKWQFYINDVPRSRRPSEFNKYHLKALLKDKSRQTSRELVEKMNCDQKTILNYLHSGVCRKIGCLGAS